MRNHFGLNQREFRFDCENCGVCVCVIKLFSSQTIKWWSVEKKENMQQSNLPASPVESPLKPWISLHSTFYFNLTLALDTHCRLCHKITVELGTQALLDRGFDCVYAHRKNYVTTTIKRLIWFISSPFVSLCSYRFSEGNVMVKISQQQNKKKQKKKPIGKLKPLYF